MSKACDFPMGHDFEVVERMDTDEEDSEYTLLCHKCGEMRIVVPEQMAPPSSEYIAALIERAFSSQDRSPLIREQADAVQREALERWREHLRGPESG